MEEVGRVPDQAVIKTSREQLVELIAYQKVEFESCLDKALALESEIIKLEDKLYSRGESLNNPVTCHNQIMFAQKKCEECGLFKRCIYRGKGDYGRFRL